MCLLLKTLYTKRFPRYNHILSQVGGAQWKALGFIHEKLDIKILILYILNHLPAAVDAQTLSDLVFCDNGIGYFDYSDCLAELVDTAHITEEGGKYRITEKGSRNVNEVASSLPYSVRMKADRVTEPIAEQMRRAAMIVAQHTNTPEGGCNVHLALSDGHWADRLHAAPGCR